MSILIKNRHLPSGSTGVVLPTGNNIQRPTNPLDGMIRYNVTNGGFVEYYNSASNSWVAVISTTSVGYGDSNVASFLTIYTGDIGANNIYLQGNITASYFIGNGSQLTGLPAGYTNAKVAAYLASGNNPTINIINSNIGNTNSAVSVLSTNIGKVNANVANTNANVANLANLLSNVNSNITAIQGQAYSNVNVSSYLTIYTGNITAGNISLSGNITSNYVLGNGSRLTGIVTDTGNILINDTTISSKTANLIVFAGTDGIVIPTGTANQYPLNPTIGTTRFNSTLSTLETWNGTTWLSSAGNKTVGDQQIIPDGVTNTYALTQATTPVASLVTINGIVQTPNISYQISNGNSIVFNQTPLTGDAIDIRYLSGIPANFSTSSTTYSNISVTAYAESGWAGNIIPAGNNYSLGTQDNPWDELWVSGSTVHIGEGALSASNGNFYVGGSQLITQNQLDQTSPKLTVLTVAEVETILSPVVGEMIFVSDGDAGKPTVAIYDGITWKKITLGNTISAF